MATSGVTETLVDEHLKRNTRYVPCYTFLAYAWVYVWQFSA